METKEKSKVGRKRLYPIGSIARKTKVPPDLDAALAAYCGRQEVPPDPSAVLLVALRKFLTESGDYSV